MTWAERGSTRRSSARCSSVSRKPSFPGVTPMKHRPAFRSRRRAVVRSTDAVRPGEIAGTLPEGFDAGLYFIGRIRTPWAERRDCPHRGAHDGPLCRIEIDERWRPAMAGPEGQEFVQVLYFMHQARRDLLVQAPKGRKATFGTFALPSPEPPNPTASPVVQLKAFQATRSLSL